MLSPANKSTYYKKTSLSTLLILLGLIALLIWALFNRQNISDWWKLRNYHEPPAISQLSAEDTMTPLAQKILKVNNPQIQDKAVFGKNCPNNGGELTIVLGCYHAGQNGIFLLNETDPRLNGVEQVTAAHEMLHAAYERLSSGEKNKVNAMLLSYYNNDLSDTRIKATMALYQKTEPHDVVNEMHSVFGTEILNLPANLESYYSRYFTNRRAIAQFAASYQSEFTTRQAAVTQDDQQLSQLKGQINSLQSDISSRLTSINALQSQLTSDKNSGNILAYNQGVPGYNALVEQYNSEVLQLRSLIDSYNALVNQRNNEALTENQLYQELSGNQATINP